MLSSSFASNRSAITIAKRLGCQRGIYIPRVTERKVNERGPGGRSSESGQIVAVFGAGGFLGRYVCYNNGSNGVKTYVGNRADEFEMRHLNPMFDLGRLRKVFYSPRDRDSMAEVIADADVVVNLVGKHYETRCLSNTSKFPYLEIKTNFTFEDCNVSIPRTIAELCTEMQVDNLIHVSSLAAKEDALSEWSRTKWQGEMAVREAYPWATVVRPSQLFGHEDRLLHYYANAANMLPFVPFIAGSQALTQPVYVGDIADVISRVIDDPERFEGKTIDCFGPDDFTYRELAEFVYDITSQEPKMRDIPKSAYLALAKFTQVMANPSLTTDLVELWSEDYTPRMSQEEYKAQSRAKDGILTMIDFDIEPVPVQKIAFEYLHRFRQGGHFILADSYHGRKNQDIPVEAHHIKQ